MKPRSLVLLLAFASLAVKLYCAATTIGTSDVIFFWKFAEFVHEHGLIAMYQDTPYFNHTPLIGMFSHAAYALAGGEKLVFAFYLRLPSIFADFVAVLALLWLREKTGRPAWWALAIFAASPVTFMISGYHGNVDPLMAVVVLLAAIACAVDRPALCGLALGLSCNVKIIPLLLAPVFFFHWWQRGRALRFTLPTVLVVLIGWSAPLLSIPGVFLKNVLGYGSIWGVWGITYMLRMTDLPALRGIAFTDVSPEQAMIMQVLKYTIVVSVLALAWFRRKGRPIEIFHTLALAWAVFFVFAPGFGVQYLAWLAPCFLVASERWYAALTAASSIAAFVFYNVISRGMPWQTGFTVHSLEAHWTPWLLLPWAVLAAYLGTSLVCLRVKPTSAPEPASLGV